MQQNLEQKCIKNIVTIQLISKIEEQTIRNKYNLASLIARCKICDAGIMRSDAYALTANA